MKYLKIYKGKKVLITGNTGFKGTWLSLWLDMLGAKVVGISKLPHTKPSNFLEHKLDKKFKTFFFDIKDKKKVEVTVKRINPDFIFHLAAQSLVLKSYEKPLDTWHTNLIGTLNILNSLKKIKKICSVVLITSDKCYKNLETKRAYKESDRLGGDDPYSASKASAELLINSYVKSFYNKKKNIRISSVRAGNVVGGGDWSNYRLFPDCIKSIFKKKKIILRNPKSTRPWQHVLEPLNGYLKLGSHLYVSNKFHGHSFNFGPSFKKNYRVIDVMNEIKKNIPEAKWKVLKNGVKDENKLLKLDSKKSLTLLRWKNLLNFQNTIYYTTEWYKNYRKNKNIIEFSKKQITNFTKLI